MWTDEEFAKGEGVEVDGIARLGSERSKRRIKSRAKEKKEPTPNLLSTRHQ